MGIPHSLFEEKLEHMKEAKGVKLDTDLSASDLKELVKQYKNVYIETKGEEFPSGTKFIITATAYFFMSSCAKILKFYGFNCINPQIQRSSCSYLLKQCLILGTAQGPSSIEASIR